MLESNIAECIVFNKRIKKWLEIRGYNAEIGDTVKVPVELLNKGDRARVYAKCDICGEIKKIAYSSYMQNIENQGFYCCKKCKYVKQKNTNMKKYGVECLLLNEEIREKGIKTSMEKYGTPVPIASEECRRRIENANIKKYGVKYPISIDSIKEKMKSTNLKRYGVEYIGASPDIQRKIKDTNLKKYGSENVFSNREIYDKAIATRLLNLNGEYTFTSRQQSYIHSVYGGELNAHIGGYFVDILLNNHVFFEYDGGGHDLSVKAGWLTREQFDEKEIKRSAYLKGAGYREFRIISSNNKTPDKYTLLSLIEYAYLQFDKNFTSVIYNLDNNTTIIK